MLRVGHNELDTQGVLARLQRGSRWVILSPEEHRTSVCHLTWSGARQAGRAQQAAPMGASAGGGDVDDDLQARLNNLRKS